MEKLLSDSSVYDDEDAWEGSEEIKEELTVKKPLDKVVPIRLDAALWDQLRVEAKARGIGPTTLARMWLIERLKYGAHHQPA